jgi:D-methionine transport system ATP-binding protein
LARFLFCGGIVCNLANHLPHHREATLIEIKNLCKSFGDREVLHDINLTVNDGDVFGIIGASGAGKSTLVRCVNLLERPTSGSVVIDGRDVTDLKGRELHELRNGIGMIFQNFSLFQQRSVLENVLFPLQINHVDKAAALERAEKLIEMVGLSGHEGSYPSQLSGGMQQRVAIARALANEPRVMLCDEATSALDTRTTVSILDLLAQVNRDMGVTMLMITHSLAVAKRVCNRIAVIDDGRIVEEGPTQEVFLHPKSQMTKDLIAFDTLVSTLPADEQGKAVL